MKKGQSAIEFMLLVGFLLFAFITFLAISSGDMTENIRVRNNQMLYDVAFTIHSEIDLAYNSLDGYSRDFNIPNDIYGMEYSISVVGGIASVKTLNGNYALGIPIKNVTGLVNPGLNTIVKKDGLVKINE